MLRFLTNIALTVWLAFLAACVIECHRPADLGGVPGLDPPAKPAVPDLLDRVEQSVWNRNAPLVLTEAEVNRYLATVISGRQDGLSGRVTEFERVAVSFDDNLCRVWLCWRTEGARRTASVDFTLKRSDMNFVIEPVRGSLGRLPVFRGALTILVPGLRNLCQALDEEIHAVFQMNQIRFEKKKVLLDPRFDGVK